MLVVSSWCCRCCCTCWRHKQVEWHCKCATRTATAARAAAAMGWWSGSGSGSFPHSSSQWQQQPSASSSLIVIANEWMHLLPLSGRIVCSASAPVAGPFCCCLSHSLAQMMSRAIQQTTPATQHRLQVRLQRQGACNTFCGLLLLLQLLLPLFSLLLLPFVAA